MLKTTKRNPSRAPRRARKPTGGLRVPRLNPRLQFVKSGEFVPSKFRTSLRIAANLSAAASTTSANIVLSGNNLFDPLLSSGVNKCVGWTQLAALYNRYRVLGSKISVVCVMSTTITTGTAQVSGAVCVAPSNTGLGRTLFSDAISQPHAKWVDITSSQTKRMEITMATSKLTGNKTPEASDRTQGLISGPPGEEVYWIITYVSDGNYVTTFVVMDIQITYDVEFLDRNEIDRSSISGQQIQQLYDQIYQVRVKDLLETKKPHNEQLPWNKAKQAPEIIPTQESKEDSKSGYVHVEPDIEEAEHPSFIRGFPVRAFRAPSNTAPVRTVQGATPQTPAKGSTK